MDLGTGGSVRSITNMLSVFPTQSVSAVKAEVCVCVHVRVSMCSFL